MAIAERVFTVCVQCFTYNQEAYILDALNGFVSQNTSFPVVSVIVDDASTDNEPQVIQDFFDSYFDREDSTVAYCEETDFGTILFAQHKVNRNCFFAILFLKENHFIQKKSKFPYLSRWTENSRYIALCEGDDYWTDPMKLQTQVDFLEGHEEYSLCCHRYMIYDQSRDTWKEDYVHALFDRQPEGFSFTRSDNLRTWTTKTMTLMYRRDWIKMEDLQKYKYRCDEHMNYHLLSRGHGYCLPFVGAVYRRTDSGVFAPLPEKKKRIRGVSVRGELLANNLQDTDLRDDVFMRLKKYLYQYGSFSSVMTPVGVCLKSYYKTDGLKAYLRSAKKLLGAFYKGFSKGVYSK